MGSVGGIANGYGMDRPKIDPVLGEIFGTCPDRLWGAPNSLRNGYRVFLGSKKRPGRDDDPSPISSAVVKKV